MRKTNGFTRKTIDYFTREMGEHYLLRVKPFVLRVNQDYHYTLTYCSTRKTNCITRETLVGANRVRIHLFRIKRIVLRVNQNTTIFQCIVLSVKLMVLRVKSIVLRVKTCVLRVKHWINDPLWP